MYLADNLVPHRHLLEGNTGVQGRGKDLPKSLADNLVPHRHLLDGNTGVQGRGKDLPKSRVAH